MKKVILILIISLFAFAKEYSIIAFSTKTFDKKAAQKFIKRFPNGIVKQYTRFVEYKIEPFKSYKAAKEYLKKVKKYYKYPLIIPYNPNLGIVLYPKNKEHFVKVVKPKNKLSASYITPVAIKKKNNWLIYCKGECGCNTKKNYSWEVNKTKVLSSIHIEVKDYLKNENNISLKVVKVTSENNNSSTQKNNNIFTCKYPSVSNYIFYWDVYGNLYQGQKYTSRLYGDSENIKLGIIYEKFFWNNWKFFTDDRIILSRKNSSGDVSFDAYLDINELYIRSYCLNCDMANILIGRKKTKDFRSWWYDAPLDEIMVFNENNLLTYQLIAATRINNETITDDNSPKSKLKHSSFFILHTNYEYYYRKNVGFYYIYEHSKPNDGYIKNRKLSFLGVDLNGFEKNLFYWLNVGYSGGKINKYTKTNRSDGYGFDIGFRAPYSQKLSYAASYAFGSGSHYFTQPYIATNNSDYLNKSFSFRYYGNVLNPVLENLHIISLYGIYDFNPKAALIASLHNYRQDVKKKVQFNTKYFYPTNGKSKDIGNEIDLVYQYNTTKKQKLKIGAGYFLGGDAFNYLSEKNAYRIFVNYRYYWK
ncbi:alginate export family protein [Caminibacter pacificus]|uniref:Alginate export protein n=1 Tax=Caminibacter pacificus TaxID=1424653 RepID=A0AAJ4RCX7_9BACT|nr:alginate export family protein [Caminibacter pacificus]QCI27763.1 hypothetical protein C6V80_01910 [Caminibacter pacificus]ROR40062.1 alginate export protein [Caminibacter pacificus]